MGDDGPHRLHDGPFATMVPKARALAVLAAAGLPVPCGWVVNRGSTAESALRSLLSTGAIAVRSAAATEDGEVNSGAGLGTTTLGVTTLESATAALSNAVSEQVIVQAQVSGQWLVVAASTTHGVEIEVHPIGAQAQANAELLAGATTPAYWGRLSRWDNPNTDRVAGLIKDAIRAASTAGLRTQHGWDLELVVGKDATWIVQLRPLTAPLHPGWPAFQAEVARAQSKATAVFPSHILTLDAEHNPAPLSVAHTWVMAQLAEDRGDAAGAPLVLAGWLYVATLPRQLSRRDPVGLPPISPQAALALLQQRLLPQARQRLDAIDERLRQPLTSASLRDVLDHAWAAFITMIDIYVGTLVPARRHAKPTPLRVDPTDALTLRGRGEYLDVLPATWDLASPSLAELGVTVESYESDARPLPTDPSRAAALLAEWDDHLFALGLAPLRNLYRAVGRATGLDHDVFLLRGPELLAALDGIHPDLDQRRLTQQSQQRLTPPLSIDNGQPVTARTRAPWSGIAVGGPFTGEAARREDLSALLANPPPATSVVMMPALTAPAAVALHAAGVGAVCCEHGGPLSHAALMARELGLSALIGCRGCMSVTDGTRVTLDTRLGRLRIDG